MPDQKFEIRVEWCEAGGVPYYRIIRLWHGLGEAHDIPVREETFGPEDIKAKARDRFELESDVEVDIVGYKCIFGGVVPENFLP